MKLKRGNIVPDSVVFLALFAAVLCAYGVGYSQETDKPPSAPPIDLSDYLTGPVERGESPGLIAAVIDENGVKAIGAAGLRRQGSRSSMKANDLVHIGSNTKAMTATMLATLVADGTFPKGWDTTIGDVYPKLAKKIHAKYRSVTLSQMVRMEGGMPPNAKNWGAYSKQSNIRKRRYAIVRGSLKQAPAGPKGKFLYSNLSYVVAALLAEGRTKKSWETLMQERLFNPLGMTSAGFGPPGTPRKVDQPWGHSLKEGLNKCLLHFSDAQGGSALSALLTFSVTYSYRKWWHIPVPREPLINQRFLKGGAWKPNQFDNDPSLGPAGTVHLSVADYAKFIQLWFPNRQPEILNRDMLNELVRPGRSPENYAAGWGVQEEDWAAGDKLYHAGSNTWWYANLWIAPQRSVAYLAVANAADLYDGNTVSFTIDSLFGKLIQDGL